VSAFPPPFRPMLATDGQLPVGRTGWVFEEKVDGYRTIAYKQGNAVALVSRNLRNLMPRFRGVGAAFAGLPADTLILDGEIARFDENLVSDLRYIKNEEQARVTDPIFVAFDCLLARGQDLRPQPLRVRRGVLERELAGAEGPILIARRLSDDARQAWAEVKTRGYEGLVAKDEASIYEPGKRTRSWLKVKYRIRQGWPEENLEHRRG
jgi:bifunctional non-homologous end joining protein LigD